MGFSIRLATQADAPDAVRVVKAVFDEYGFTWDEADYHADLYDLQGHYLDPGDLFWVAELDGQTVGTVALEFYDKLPGEPGQAITHEDTQRAAGTDCSLERLYVHPDGRRQGIGHALTQTVIDEAKQRNREAMELWSDKRFGDAHRLYGRFGAEVIGERICDDPDESAEWGLVVRL